MKIKVRDLKPEGIQVVDKINTEVFELNKDGDSRFKGPLDVTVKVERISNTVMATTNIKGIYASFCGRCLESVEEVWAKSFLFHIPINEKTETIDLGEEIRQEVLLNLPVRILCKEDCKGICIGCGADLNRESCRCKT